MYTGVRASCGATSTSSAIRKTIPAIAAATTEVMIARGTER